MGSCSRKTEERSGCITPAKPGHVGASAPLHTVHSTHSAPFTQRTVGLVPPSPCARERRTTPSLTLERPKIIGGRSAPQDRPPPPLQTKVTIVGKNEIYKRENLMAPFWYTNFWVPDPPSPPALFSSNVGIPPPPPTTTCEGRLFLWAA